MHCFEQLAIELLVLVLVTEGLLELVDVLVDTLVLELIDVLVDTLVHVLPVNAGFSAAPPFLSPWKPKLTDCPGCMVLFQSRLVAV